MPPALQNEPWLEDPLEDYLDAFWALSAGRVVGLAPCGISFADLAAYCQLYSLPNPTRFIGYMRALDAEFLAFHAEAGKGKT